MSRVLRSQMGVVSKPRLVRLLIVAALAMQLPWPPSAFGQTHPGKFGIGLEGIGGRGLEFVDVARTARGFEVIGGGAVAKDAAGWPMSDARSVIFDMRPVAAWLGTSSIDDPQKYQINVSGTYKLSFKGQATITYPSDLTGVTVSNTVYNSSTNTTTADVTVASGSALLILDFVNTKRTSTSATNTGITELKMTRPGYAHTTTQLFHTPFIDCLKNVNFIAVRFMDWTNTNNNNKTYPGTHAWSDRPLMNKAADALWNDNVKMLGAPWESVVLLANQVNKDIWINVPVGVTDDYVTKLAQLLRYGSDGVNPYTSAVSSPIYPPLASHLNVYVEHSNEVWNGMFTQQAWNKSQADSRGITEHQNHARRTVEIAQIFSNVFGSSAMNSRVRVVLASHAPMLEWWVQPMLNYVNSTYGPPKNYIYMIARQTYFAPASKGTSDTVSTLLSKARQDIDAQCATDSTNNANRSQWISKANTWQLLGKAGSYEGGPHFPSDGNTTLIATEINTNRDAGMGDLLKYNVGAKWADLGGGLAMHFTMTSGYNRYGCWGLTDDVTNPDRNYKFAAFRTMLGSGVAPAAPTNLTASAGDGQVSLSWSASSGASSYNVKRSTTSGSGYSNVATGVTTTSYTNTGLTNGTTYYYVVSAVNSGGESGNSNQASATPTASSTGGGSGTITREVWNNVTGTAVSAIPVTSTPSSTGSLTLLEAPSNVGDNYGQRLRGYITAPQTGSYTFWIAADDNCELYLSTNDQASSKTRIAYHTGWTNSREWNKYTTQKSASISLTAGVKYYVEVLMKEGSGGDNLAVGWLKPGQSGTVPSEVIPGSVLSPWTGGSTPTNPASLFTNAGFENDLTGWSNNGYSSITTDAASGAKAAITGTGQGGISQEISYTAGGTLNISVKAKLSGSVSGWSGMGIDFLDSSGTELGETSTQVTATSYATWSNASVTVPTGTARLRFWTWKPGTTGSLLVDDVVVNKN